MSTPAIDPNISRQEDNNLKIQMYSRLLKRGFYRLRFPTSIEQSFTDDRNQTHGNSSRLSLCLGLLFYLCFGISDSWLASFHIDGQPIVSFYELFLPRLALTVVSILIVFLTYKFEMTKWIYPLSTLGFTLVGWSIIYFIHLLPAPFTFIYYIGFLPIQMYAIIVLRQSLRSVIIVSLGIYLGFLLYLDLYPPQTVTSGNLQFYINSIVPAYLIYWGIIIALSFYIVYLSEYAIRKEFIQKQIVKLESENLTIMKDQLQTLAITDPLTQLYNRRFFEDTLNKEWRMATRHQDVISLVMIDVDHFKAYNDHYGHQAGDRCLQIIASTLKHHTQRAGDLAVRFGGEEFILLFPKMTEKEACQLAEKLRSSVEQIRIPHEESSHEIVTISIGVSSQTPEMGDNPEDLIRNADLQLYRSKQQGRNRASCNCSCPNR